jgi:hypothetical protein
MLLHRAVRECLLEEVTVMRKGRRIKVTRLESLVLKLYADTMSGSVPAARVILGLAENHIPPNQTLEEIRGHRPVYEFTKAERDAFLKAPEEVELGKPGDGN